MHDVHLLLQPSLVLLSLARDALATLAISHFLSMSCFLPFGDLDIIPLCLLGSLTLEIYLLAYVIPVLRFP